MKSSIFVAATFLAGGVLGAPSNRLAERIHSRSEPRRSGPLLLSTEDRSSSNESNATTPVQVAYSSNWAGVVRESPPPEGPYTAVSATFTVPAAKATGSNTDETGAGSAWVGIDGDTYAAAILQTGVDFYLQHGRVVNRAWFEWYPNYAYDFSLAINTGDVIVAKVKALSPRDGVAIIENETTGESATQTLQAPEASATLAGENAEWIVEDFQSGDALVSLVDFRSVHFTGVRAEAGGESFGLDGVTVIELKQNNKVRTAVQLGEDEFTVSYRA